MSKIATLTTHAALNYGAVLQAYALSYYLGNNGHECHVLNYIPHHVTKAYRLIQMPRSIRGGILSLFQLIHYRARKQRLNKFKAFREEFLPLSGGSIKDHQLLVQLANQYDCVICGSDQIWNPILHDFDEGYFLSFPGVCVHKLSYAASFGQDQIGESVKPELRRRLEGFSAFACRERSAQELIRELTGRCSEFVLDPVFLLDQNVWEKLAYPMDENKAYALVYFLSNPGKSLGAVREIAKNNGLKTISIGFSPRDVVRGIDYEYGFGPQEFLSAIKHADTIVTNSFHCVAFSILFQKNFYVRIESGQASRNDRIISLLHELGLENRMFYDRDSNALDFSREIDYTEVSSRLQKLIDRSAMYLKDCLGRLHGED